MKPLALICLTASLACAQFSAQITSVNQTQAILQETGYSGACTIQVSASPGFSPVIPDFNGSEYSGSNIDTSRADTITSTSGTQRWVTVGHMNSDRALAASTTYYYQISGCGSSSGSFATSTLASGVTRSESSPFSTAKWGNLDFPPFDWTTPKRYTDPTTGVTMTPLSLGGATWRTGCGTSGCTASAGLFNFTDWSGTDGGWTTPGNIVSGGNATIGFGDTTPIYLWPDLALASGPFAFGLPLPYDFHRILDDVGVTFSGSATVLTGGSNVLSFCIVFSPTGGCVSNTFTVSFTGSFAPVVSGSSDVDGAFPATFPTRGAIGDWATGISPLFKQENLETNGTLTVSGSTLTIASPTGQSHFSNALTSGAKIFINGSGCVNSLCTVAASPTVSGSITVSETPTSGSATYRAYGWGLAMWRAGTPTGTITFTTKYKLAGAGSPPGMQSLGDQCSTVPVTSGDGKTGYLCFYTSTTTNAGSVNFLATDGTSRFIDFAPSAYFDNVAGNVWYNGSTVSGGWTVIKNTYSGDYSGIDYQYLCSPNNGCPSITPMGCSQPFCVTSMNLMPHASNQDLGQQITANWASTYDNTLYGQWVSANAQIAFAAVSGSFASFTNTYSGQSNPGAGGPGWIAIVDLTQTPATVTRMLHTLDGTGNPSMRYSGLHTSQAAAAIPNTIGSSGEILSTNSTSTLFGGPFQAVVTSVLEADGVTWNSADTSLPGPPFTSVSYFPTCPMGSAPFIDCVTIRLPQNGVCNVAATATEISRWPCPWNASFSQYPVMTVGDNASDLAGNVGDNEHFRILSTAPDAGNTLRVVMARNADYDYCSFTPWHGQTNFLSRQSSGQLVHANGWTLTMMPGQVNACALGGNFLFNESTGAYSELGRSFTVHSASGVGPTGNVNLFNSFISMYDTPIANLSAIPPLYVTPEEPTYAGNGANIGGSNPGTQSYLDDRQNAPGGYAFGIDVNTVGPNAGTCSAETLGCGQGIGMSSTGTANVYTVSSPFGGLTANKTTYKTQPMIGWAGQNLLQDVSGPSSIVDSTPYSMCFVITAGECHAGSTANQIYVNIPAAFTPYCTTGMSWSNNGCVMFGLNAPVNAVRQFRIYGNNIVGGSIADINGSSSRFISQGWSSPGRPYPFTHATMYPTGKAFLYMGSNLMDGYTMTGFMVTIPSWQESSNINNQLKNISVQIPSGASFAEVQFGYSRYLGPGATLSNGLYCTSRSDACEAGSNLSPFAFASETQTATSCASGCTIKIPVVGPNVVYYQIRRSPDGSTWTNGNIQAVAVQ